MFDSELEALMLKRSRAQLLIFGKAARNADKRISVYVFPLSGVGVWPVRGVMAATFRLMHEA